MTQKTTTDPVRPLRSAEALAEGVRAGDRRAVARLITLVENDDERAQHALRLLHPDQGGAHVIGVTGSPGTGKSTLTDRLIAHYRDQDKRVGVIAVDPSSPFSGGAILGDRIRMQSRSNDVEVFIRSMGTRGALGGLSSHSNDAVKVLDAAGCDIILVETVGVGQAEIDVIRLADTVALILVPNLGDDIQAAKAGIMEIADLFVVNKADLDGADKVASEVEAIMSLSHPDEEDFWWPPILRTIAERNEGIDAVAGALEKHREWSMRHGTWHARRQERLRQQIRVILGRRVTAFAFRDDGDIREPFAPLLQEVRDGIRSPQAAADEILAAFGRTV